MFFFFVKKESCLIRKVAKRKEEEERKKTKRENNEQQIKRKALTLSPFPPLKVTIVAPLRLKPLLKVSHSLLPSLLLFYSSFSNSYYSHNEKIVHAWSLFHYKGKPQCHFVKYYITFQCILVCLNIYFSNNNKIYVDEFSSSLCLVVVKA